MRITPACAGNSVQNVDFVQGLGDHPRVCGEQLAMPTTCSHVAGSPPRVRGTDMRQRAHDLGVGITPACAGNRRSIILLSKTAWDHPRVCGEQGSQAAAQHTEEGSPPRVRGTGIIIMAFFGMTRITPACAGNRQLPISPLATVQDHPRVCGEQLIQKTRLINGLGSPPRVRGTGNSSLDVSERKRITPACAGNRAGLFRQKNLRGDHPRVCGEQSVSSNISTCSKGSPPRVRGTVSVRAGNSMTVGITPACAGNRSPPNGQL